MHNILLVFRLIPVISSVKQSFVGALRLNFINQEEQVISRYEAKSCGNCSNVNLRKYRIVKKIAIVGDIHGCYDELNEMLDTIDWSP